jgi:hypothetical protein
MYCSSLPECGRQRAWTTKDEGPPDVELLVRDVDREIVQAVDNLAEGALHLHAREHRADTAVNPDAECQVLPRVEKIRDYLDAKTFDAYTESDLRLARLVFAWVPVAEAVEVFKQPRVPHSKMYWDVKDEPEL